MNNRTKILFLYPNNPLNEKTIDDHYVEEANYIQKKGLSTVIISLENMKLRLINVTSKFSHEDKVVYRGWMLSPKEYNEFIMSIQKQNMIPLTSIDNYLSTHYLPNWYPLISDLTPETLIFDVSEDLPSKISSLNWNGYFVKDYVKSLKTSIGSLIYSPDDILKVVDEMKKYRGIIEGGLCVRRVENYKTDSEKRYFVIKNHPFSPDDNKIPDIVYHCASRIKSPFFSIDIAERDDGQLRVVEIGDGQVSDLVGWSVERFTDIWLQSIDNL